MRLSSGTEPRQQNSQGHGGNGEQSYFAMSSSKQQREPPDCFPLPSPFVPEPEVLTFNMSGGILASPAGCDNVTHS